MANSKVMKWYDIEELNGRSMISIKPGATDYLNRNANREVSVVTVFGKSRQGKSFLLNSVVKEDLFEVMYSPYEACTAGVDLSTKLIKFTGSAPFTMFIDSEGSGMRGVPSDVILLTPLFILSNIIIFNWKGDFLLSDIFDYLGVLCKVSENLFKNDDSLFGHLIIVLRDVPEDALVTGREQAKAKLFERESSPNARCRNAVREQFKLFRSVDVICLPVPHSEAHKRAVKIGEIMPETPFQIEIDSLRLKLSALQASSGERVLYCSEIQKQLEETAWSIESETQIMPLPPIEAFNKQRAEGIQQQYLDSFRKEAVEEVDNISNTLKDFPKIAKGLADLQMESFEDECNKRRLLTDVINDSKQNFQSHVNNWIETLEREYREFDNNTNDCRYDDALYISMNRAVQKWNLLGKAENLERDWSDLVEASWKTLQRKEQKGKHKERFTKKVASIKQWMLGVNRELDEKVKKNSEKNNLHFHHHKRMKIRNEIDAQFKELKRAYDCANDRKGEIIQKLKELHRKCAKAGSYVGAAASIVTGLILIPFMLGNSLLVIISVSSAGEAGTAAILLLGASIAEYIVQKVPEFKELKKKFSLQQSILESAQRMVLYDAVIELCAPRSQLRSIYAQLHRSYQTTKITHTSLNKKWIDLDNINELAENKKGPYAELFEKTLAIIETFLETMEEILRNVDKELQDSVSTLNL